MLEAERKATVALMTEFLEKKGWHFDQDGTGCWKSFHAGVSATTEGAVTLQLMYENRVKEEL